MGFQRDIKLGGGIALEKEVAKSWYFNFKLSGGDTGKRGSWNFSFKWTACLVIAIEI